MAATQTKSPPSPKRRAKSEPDFQCQFCKKVFKSDANVARHRCKKKDRWIDRELAHVRTSFAVYEMFFKFNYGRGVTYDHFMNSTHYTLFVKFGQYIHDVNAVEPLEFARFVIEKGAGLPITKWPTDAVYEVYLRQRISRESPDVATERSIRLMEQWAEEYEEVWVDFFRNVPATLATHYIRTGRLSPLLLYITDSGQELLMRFSDEQINMMSEFIDPTLWKRRIKMNKADIDGLTNILKEAGL